MIHIVEINEQNRARVWFAFDEADFIRKVQVMFEPSLESIVFEQTTPQQLVQENRTNQSVVNTLFTKYGADTTVYRADYLLGNGTYQAEPVSPLHASLAAVATATDFRVYTNDEEAADELDRDPLYKSKQGFEASLKLRAQLVEMEVIAEDF